MKVVNSVNLVKIALVILIVSIASVAPAADWPQFLGPDSLGTSPETGLPKTFDAKKITVEWTQKIGAGYGGTAVQGSEVFLLDRVAGEKDVLRCFDAKTGDEKWSWSNAVPGRLPFAGSRSTPTVTKDAVYAAGGFGHVYCIDRKTHQPRWTVDLTKKYQGAVPRFGYSFSPVLIDDGKTVLVTAMGTQSSIIALNAESGEKIWQAKGAGTGNSTPMILNLLGQDQIVLHSVSSMGGGGGRPPRGGDRGGRRRRPPQDNQNRPGSFQNISFTPVQLNQRPPQQQSGSSDGVLITSFDIKNGQQLWQHKLAKKDQRHQAITGVAKISDDTVLLSAGYSFGTVKLKLNKNGDRIQAKEVFSLQKGSQIHQPQRVGDYLYMIVNENSNTRSSSKREGGLMCIDLNGKEQWRTGDKPYFSRGSIIQVDDYLIIQDGADGKLRIVQPDPKVYKQLVEVDVFNTGSNTSDKGMWAPMAYSDG